MAGRGTIGIVGALGLTFAGCALPRADRLAADATIVKVALPDNSSRKAFDNHPSGSGTAVGPQTGGTGIIPAGGLAGADPEPPGHSFLPPVPSVPVVETRSSAPPPYGDPRAGMAPPGRAFPTATGAALGLAPGETAAERAVELMNRIETLAKENVSLRDRILSLEANGVEREQALRETLRETDRATAEVQKARADIEAMRAELAKLRERAKRVEEDEIETLKAILNALKGLVPQQDMK